MVYSRNRNNFAIPTQDPKIPNFGKYFPIQLIYLHFIITKSNYYGIQSLRNVTEPGGW